MLHRKEFILGTENLVIRFYDLIMAGEAIDPRGGTDYYCFAK